MPNLYGRKTPAGTCVLLVYWGASMQGFITVSTIPANAYIAGLITEPANPNPVKWDLTGPLKVYFDDTGFRAWTDAEKTAALNAFAEWQAVANISFELTTVREEANILQVLTNSDQYAGQTTAPADGVNPPTIEYSVLNGQFDYIQPGGDTYLTMVHEIGHAIGLYHPHSGTTFPGVPLNADQDTGDNELNQQIWTVMSYAVGWTGQPRTTLDYGTGSGTMTFDIAAVQYLYGARAAETGDTTYALPTVNQTGIGWDAIWDTGGTDTISGAGAATSLTINLTAATLEGANAGGHVSWVTGIEGGVTIANGVVIENAIGGSGDDSITGNSANNAINGGGGTDSVIYTGDQSGYLVFTGSQGQTMVVDLTAGRDGKDSLTNVENLAFNGQSVSVSTAAVEPADADGSAYQVYRFYNTETGSHFFTTSLAERNSVIENLDGLSYEGNAFDSNVTDVNGTAVFRFYNTSNGVHFYTVSADEAASIRQNLSNFQDEGIAYYASADDSNGGTALFRFFNTSNGSHFFTVSETERDNIIATLGHYNYEGVAFYVDLA